MDASLLDRVRGPHRYPGLGMAVAMTCEPEVAEAFRTEGCKLTPFTMARDDERPWVEIVIPLTKLDEWEQQTTPF